MPDDLKTTIDQLANSLQTVTLLSTQLRRDLGESAQRAVELERQQTKPCASSSGSSRRSRGSKHRSLSTKAALDRRLAPCLPFSSKPLTLTLAFAAHSL